jgi:hypothetical protein
MSIKINDNMVFNVSKVKSPEDANLKSLEWAVVTQLNGQRTVGQIGQVLALDHAELQKIFKRLLDKDLLALSTIQGQKKSVPIEVINSIEKLYTFFIGPLAKIIMDDILSEINLSRDDISLDDLPYIIELLCLEISNEKKRFEFQKEILDKLKLT